MFSFAFGNNSVCNIEPKVKWSNIRQSALRRNKHMRLSVNHVTKLLDKDVNKGVCDYTGVEFSTDTNSPLYPTFDRINSALGYVPGNIVICTTQANLLKEKVFENGISWTRSKENDFIVNSIFKTLSTNIVVKAKKYLVKGERVNLTLNLNTLLENHKKAVLSLDYCDSEVLLSVQNPYAKAGLIKINRSSTKSDKCTIKDYNEFCRLNFKVQLTYLEFHTLMNTELCQHSGKYIENPLLIVLDKTKPVRKNSVIVIDRKYQEAYREQM
ncbi:hypothetical protein XaC1_426 [Xanthomonas phage XaC1]|nr:hypothetical protein XaC1_426 [Xanthomonas phage XaC1]